MQTTAVQPLNLPAAKAPAISARLDFMVGLALTAFVPAIFWTAVFAGVAGIIGYTPDPASLLIAGLAIAAFLGAFFTILTAKPN